MLLNISIISLIIFVAAVLLYIMCIRNKSKMANLKRISAIISAAALLCSLITAMIYVKSNNIKIFSGVKSYDIKESYTAALTKNGAESAYDLLPVAAFAQNDDLYIINSKNDAFLIEKDADLQYTLKTEFNKIAYLGADKTLKATVTTDGELILDGYLLYSKYDGEVIEYKNKTIAKNVEFCNFSSNSLFFITKSGDLYALGFNEYGQLGDSTVKNKPKPELIKSGITKASVSDTHSMMVDKFGTLYAVGDNSYSQLGNKTAVSSTEPIKIMQGVKDVRVGNYYSLVLTVNGELYTAGINENGQLGNDGQQFKAELIQTLSNVDKIEINQNSCAALTYSGELYVWGSNENNKISSKQTENITAPLKISENVYDFAISDSGIVIITTDRDILVSSQTGEPEVCITFGAQIPEIYRDKFKNKFNIFDEKV